MPILQQADSADITQLWDDYINNKTSYVRDKLIEHYLPLVKIIAGRLAMGMPHYLDKDDFISNGFFGLLDAINRYDNTRGIKFETYAVSRIRGAILDAVRAQDWVPTTLRQKARQYEQAVASLEVELGRAATDEEIAGKLDISLKQFHHLINQLNSTTIIPLEDFVKNEKVSNMVNPSQALEDEETKEILAAAIDKLPQKERIVISLYYYEGLTLKEISVILKLTEARISQLHTKAIYRLRGALSRIKFSLL